MDSMVKSTHFCSLLWKANNLQPRKLICWSTWHTFFRQKVCQTGSLPTKASTRNSDASCQTKLSSIEWNEIYSIMSVYKIMYWAYVPTDEVPRSSVAKEVIDFPTLNKIE